MEQVNYIIPFRDEVVISQGFNGPWSHRKISENTDYSYSVDFALPVSIEVLAARSGKVRFFYEGFTDFYKGLDFKIGSKYLANMIDILHDDGTIANYQHIKKGSVLELRLRDGDAVEQGQVIGRTGLSGWIGPIPHLHFMVYRNLESLLQTFPVKFRDYNGPLEHSELHI